MDHRLAKEAQTWPAQVLEQGAFGLLLLLGLVFAFEQTRPVTGVSPLALTNVEGVAVFMILFWLVARLAAASAPRLPRAIALPAITWFATLTLSTALAPAHQDKALPFMGRVVAGVAICLATYQLANTHTRRLMLIRAMATGAVAVAVLGLAEGFGFAPVVNWLDRFKVAPTRVGDLLRVSSTLSYATITAMVLEMMVPLLLALLVIARTNVWRILISVGVVAALATHVLTLSRGGIISLLAVLLLMAVAGRWRGWPGLSVAALLASLVLLLLSGLVLALQPTARLRLTTETEQSWYQARYEAPDTIRARAGELVTSPVSITNAGQRTWSAGGEAYFALAYHLYDETGAPVTFDGERTPLPMALAPEEGLTLQGRVRAPDEPGEYRVEWDMVQEGVSWFSWQGAATYPSRLVVTAGQARARGSFQRSAPPTDVRLTRPTPGRMDLWRAALQMAADYPLFGVGPDNFRWLYGEYAGVDEWDTGIHANNLYLEWLAGTGVVGFAAFIWLSWRLARLALARLRDQDEREHWMLTVGVSAALATWYIHGLFDFFYEFTPTYVAFWLLVGLLAAVPEKRRDGDADRI
jgi:hypothetical protein